jgi:hypothetical protein
MTSPAKSVVQWLANLCGAQVSDRGKCFVTARTERSAILGLIGRLMPMVTDRPLLRLGPEGDGGYLVVDDLDGISACFSPGVNTVSGFEEACANLGMGVYLADASVSGPAVSHPAFTFLKKYVGSFPETNFVTLDEWVSDSLPGDGQSDLLLQMDIEGFEYETVLAVSDRVLRRFRHVIVEFHGLEQLWNRPFFEIASRAFCKLLATHTCVHIHPNNCCGHYDFAGVCIPRVAEFTFIRTNRCRIIRPATAFPHPLDRDNTPNASLPLPPCWYAPRGQTPEGSPCSML